MVRHLGEGVARVVHDVDPAQEGLDAQSRGVAGAAAGGQHVVGARAVVAQRHRRPGAYEDRARVLHPVGDGGSVRRLDLQVLGAVRVDDPQALVHAVDEDDRGLPAAQRGDDPVLDVLGGRDLCLQLLLHRLRQLDGVRDEDGGGERVVLGLADQVGGHVHRVGGLVREDRDLGGTGLGVDADLAREVALGGGDPDVAGPGDHVGRGAGLGAVREHRDGLGTADRVHLVDAEEGAGGEDRGVRETPNSFCGGEASAMEATPASCAGTAFMITDEG